MSEGYRFVAPGMARAPGRRDSSFHEISTHCLHGFPERHEFQRLAIDMAFSRWGGLRPIDELCGLSAGRWEVDALLRHAEVLRLFRGWNLLVPVCQFDPADWSIRPGIAAIVRELRPVFDDSEIAAWFAQPNSWIGHAVPIDTCEWNFFEVLQAARADRFVAHG